MDYFLKIDGIPGESQDAKHKGEIDLASFTWPGVQHPVSSGGGGGAGAGKATFSDFEVAMRVNKASPLLFLAAATGKHIKSAMLTARRAGKEQQEFLVFKFSDVVISSYRTAADTETGAVPVDHVAFDFGRITVDYRPQRADGTLDAAVEAGWDLKTNRPI
jgi:type VI secretion system secreted protein Hcp